MNEQLKLIAMRLKELREVEDLSMSDMAEKFGITKSQYEAYESGNIDIPVGFLYDVAHAFGVELTQILAGQSPRLHVCQFTKSGKGLNVERRRAYKYQNLAYNFTQKKVEPLLVTVEYENELAPMDMHKHPGQEFNYMLEGRMKIVINNKEIILEPGDSLYFDSSYSHGAKALDNKAAKYLAIVI